MEGVKEEELEEVKEEELRGQIGGGRSLRGRRRGQGGRALRGQIGGGRSLRGRRRGQQRRAYEVKKSGRKKQM